MLVFDHLLAVQGGGYIGTLKVIPVLLILLVWTRLLTWVDKDAPAAHLPRTRINIANLCGLLVGFILFFLLPTFILSFAVLLLAFGIETGIYLTLRKKEVGLHDLQRLFKQWIESFTKKPVDAIAVDGVNITGKDGKLVPVPASDSLDRPAYDAVQNLLSEPLIKGAQQIDLAPQGDAMAVTYTVDNFAQLGPVLDKVTGLAAIAYVKWAAGLNVEDRRKPQTGTLKTNFHKEKSELKVQTAGTTAGEYLRIFVNPKARHNFKIETLGFTESQKLAVVNLIKEDKGGLILLSAPKGHGLTTLFYTLLKSHDAFLEHAHTVERDQEQDLEGITQNKLAASASSAEETKAVDWAISQEPDIVGVSKLEDARSAQLLIAYAKKGKRAYVCVRANSTFEALDQWKRLVGNNALATESLKMVINGRVLRKLCLACKEAFNPDPTTLKRLNLNPERVTTLYKAREHPMRDPKGGAIECAFCHELKFKDSVGIFETLMVDDEMRQTIEANKPLNQVFRKQRGRYLQEEALSLVELGDTSVQEVLRVLKPAAEAGQTTAVAAPATAPRTATSAPARNR